MPFVAEAHSKGQRLRSRSRSGAGIFTITLDFELMWGTRDLFGNEGFGAAVIRERALVIDRLLALFAELRIEATWCTVGHLFLDRCGASGGVKHPEIVSPDHRWYPDWFALDPCSDEENAPLYYGRSLIEKIRACAVPQEIGSHSFSHVIFGDRGCSRATAESELRACVAAAAPLGLSLQSFVFPRNQPGHLDVLREAGFTVFRGRDAHWYTRPNVPERVRRAAHLVDIVLAREPPTVVPLLTEEGLWNVPGSMIYLPAHGVRRWLPRSRRVKAGIRGLEAAVRESRVFHLWFHPTNLADDMEEMFAGLREILEHARALEDAGRLRIRALRDVPAEFLDEERPSARDSDGPSLRSTGPA
jgi:hypothetical protein